MRRSSTVFAGQLSLFDQPSEDDPLGTGPCPVEVANAPTTPTAPLRPDVVSRDVVRPDVVSGTAARIEANLAALRLAVFYQSLGTPVADDEDRSVLARYSGWGGLAQVFVEDDPALRRVVEVNLTIRGYEVDTAVSGTAALKLTEHHPDLIVVDLGLPDMDGIDLITRIRTSSTILILVTSARDVQTAKVAALQAGADDYLPKPFGVDQLIGRVRTLLSKQEPPNGVAVRSTA